MSYYRGDLNADLASLAASPEAETAIVLDQIAKKIGYGRAQQILQIMWARSLRDQKIPTSGALLPEPPAVPDGFALVPVKPTGDMVFAGHKAASSPVAGMHDIWAAMLSASQRKEE